MKGISGTSRTIFYWNF